jgi:hypothetical protein
VEVFALDSVRHGWAAHSLNGATRGRKDETLWDDTGEIF